MRDVSSGEAARHNPAHDPTPDLSPRSQTLFGNAIVRETLFRFPYAQTEFARQWHSQTEFGNEAAARLLG